jgi:GST-like protein
VTRHERQHQRIDDFAHVKRWLDAIKARPAVKHAYAKAKEVNPNAGGTRTPEERTTGLRLSRSDNG